MDRRRSPHDGRVRILGLRPYHPQGVTRSAGGAYAIDPHRGYGGGGREKSLRYVTLAIVSYIPGTHTPALSYHRLIVYLSSGISLVVVAPGCAWLAVSLQITTAGWHLM
ncbi:hypothetical protein OBBRIDRAFT_377900 [Obba rivulosa]|uniref:Uncharacterized protein n=1 Tax=Obba rivulosa TaxID=1052685 RepID=A0A8E2AJZ0_9APHY|nr:hypothetical protein OBBRIDRAFT_377900 [Obba rivulosa]